MKWRWRVDGHTVDLEVSFWTGAKRLAVDGAPVPVENKLALRWTHELALGERRATITVVLRYLIILDASLEQDGATVAPADGPPPLPTWAWLFAIANAAILVVSVGGALPGAIAGMGAVSALYAARLRAPLATRVTAAAGVTAAAWGAFFLLYRALTS